MREIKFRGKSDNDWAYGYLLKVDEINQAEHEHFNYFIQSDYIQFEEYVTYYITDDNTIGQFTGLHDKNGKEIYDGDIVKATYEFENNETSSEIGVVKNKIHKFILENRQKYEFEIEYFDYLEVIGNVWDNPELLERS